MTPQIPYVPLFQGQIWFYGKKTRGYFINFFWKFLRTRRTRLEGTPGENIYNWNENKIRLRCKKWGRKPDFLENIINKTVDWTKYTQLMQFIHKIKFETWKMLLKLGPLCYKILNLGSKRRKNLLFANFTGNTLILKAPNLLKLSTWIRRVKTTWHLLATYLLYLTLTLIDSADKLNVYFSLSY